MKRKSERLEEIDVVRQERDKIHVFGRSKEGTYLHHIVHNAYPGKILNQSSFKKKGDLDYDVADAKPISGIEAMLGLCILPLLGMAVGLYFNPDSPNSYHIVKNIAIASLAAPFVLPFTAIVVNSFRPSVRSRRKATLAYENIIGYSQERNKEKLDEAIKELETYIG